MLESGFGNSTYLDYDRLITEETLSWIDYTAKNNKKNKWALFVSLVCPHPPWIAPEEYSKLYPVEDIELPIAYNEDERPMHQGLEDYRKYFGIQNTFEEKTVRKVTAAYYGMISFLDNNIGKIINKLKETGLYDNTRLIYSSDHGESMGHKGMFSKCNMFEESVSVPLIISGNDIPKNNKNDELVQLIDIYPTILESFNIAKSNEEEFLGKSLLKIAKEKKYNRPVISEQHSAGAKSAVFMFRKGKWKFVLLL